MCKLTQLEIHNPPLDGYLQTISIWMNCWIWRADVFKVKHYLSSFVHVLTCSTVRLTQIHIRGLGSLWIGAALVYSVEQLLFDLSDGVAVQTLDRHLGGILILWVYTVQCLAEKQVQTKRDGVRQKKFGLSRDTTRTVPTSDMFGWLFHCISMYQTPFSHLVCLQQLFFKNLDISLACSLCLWLQ